MSKFVLYFSYDKEKPVRMKGRPSSFNSEESLWLGNGLSLLYDMSHYGKGGNKALKRYGYIFSDIPGNAVLVYENKKGLADIPEDILSRLPLILENDAKARNRFINDF